ncbi:MAG TPA: protein-L-isoaspartate(D-aspartate) O-methyltransferase [Hyphomicrobiaceae bacterium]|nr:protein-L-isoaspartate(D-aspartate) O-methyltransferase [Hyphomicrobiaceae bacterium]
MMKSWAPLTAAALASALLASAAATSPGVAAGRAEERHRMVETIERTALAIGASTGHPKLDARVLGALRSVPRHELVPAEAAPRAYDDRPLDIGFKQSISQPFIVGLMTHLLQVQPSDRVLEVGTGSGYQAAVLAVLARQVYSVEIVPELGNRAAQALARLGYANVAVRIADGYHGWEAHAPYDRIIVTAAPDHIPPALLAQLKPGGRLVIPVGSIDPGIQVQDLMVIDKAADGATTSTTIIPVRFVPLTRERKGD